MKDKINQITNSFEGINNTLDSIENRTSGLEERTSGTEDRAKWSWIHRSNKGKNYRMWPEYRRTLR